MENTSNCMGCDVAINDNEIEAYDHKCHQCFRNNFQSEESEQDDCCEE